VKQMSKTILRHTLIKNIFDIFVDFLISIHFHYMKMHSLPSSLQRRNIFRQDLSKSSFKFKLHCICFNHTQSSRSVRSYMYLMPLRFSLTLICLLNEK